MERERNEEKFNNLFIRCVPEAAKPFLGQMRYSFIHCVCVCAQVCVVLVYMCGWVC